MNKNYESRHSQCIISNRHVIWLIRLDYISDFQANLTKITIHLTKGYFSLFMVNSIIHKRSEIEIHAHCTWIHDNNDNWISEIVVKLFACLKWRWIAENWKNRPLKLAQHLWFRNCNWYACAYNNDSHAFRMHSYFVLLVSQQQKINWPNVSFVFD